MRLGAVILFIQPGLLLLTIDGGLDPTGVGERHTFDMEAAAVVDLDGEGTIDQAPDGDVGDLLEPNEFVFWLCQPVRISTRSV